MSDTHLPVTDDLLARNQAFAANFPADDLPAEPALRLAAVVCMDSRIDVFAALGLNNGDAHVIRNAGGVITDDVVRSLCLSQRKLGTREIVLVHHTKCGLQTIDDAEFVAELMADAGHEPPWAVQSFDDPATSVRESIRRLQMSPFLPHTDNIRGFVYDVDIGVLREVTD